MKVLTVPNDKRISEILRVTDEWNKARGPYCYRGQSIPTYQSIENKSALRLSLVPKIFRHLYEKYKDEPQGGPTREDSKRAQEFEIQTYSEFRERSRGYKHERVDPNNQWEMLCLAQHFGVPTRLLDWTSNLWVAAFFAVEDLNEDRDGVIWSFNVGKFLEKYHGVNKDSAEALMVPSLDTLPNRDVTFLKDSWLKGLPEDVEGRICKSSIRLIRPPDIDDRMKIQSSLFTIYVSIRKPQEPDFAEYWDHYQLMGGDESDTLKALVIPGKRKPGFLESLMRMGIHHHSLFPGFSGLGRYLTTLQRSLLENSD